MKGLTRTGSTMMGVRLPLSVVADIKARAAKRGESVNQWLTRAVNNALRKR